MTLLHDIRFALRSLGKSPGFTIVVITALALGIGANIAAFTLTNGILFKGFPFDKSDRILYLITKDAALPETRFSGVSYPDFRDWRALTKSFDGLTAYTGQRVTISDKNGLPESYLACQMNANGFRLIGQRPSIGRDFDESDDVPGAAPVAILNNGLWQRRYGGDPNIIGRILRISGRQTTVIGVMPRGFAFPFDADVWLPLVPTVSAAELEKREERDDLVAFGRLKDGSALSTARAEMATISRNLQSSYTTTNQGIDAWVRTYGEFYFGPNIRASFLAMLGAVIFLLLIASANVANLLLARAVSRTREISIRAALGAGRWRIVRQLLVESLILSLIGSAIGWLLARWGVRVFDAVAISFRKPSWVKFDMDHRVLLYVIGISIGTGVLFGLVPALRLAKLDVNASLREGGRGAGRSRGEKRLSSVLVIAEMALAVVLMAGAGLMVRTFLNIYRAPLGINENNVLTMRLPLPEGKYRQPNDWVLFHERLRPRLQSIPGVQWVGISNYLPTGGSTQFSYELEGAPPESSKRRPTLAALVISSDYFRVMDVRPLAGRVFTNDDGFVGPPVAIVNERFANKVWPSVKSVRQAVSAVQRSRSRALANRRWRGTEYRAKRYHSKRDRPADLYTLSPEANVRHGHSGPYLRAARFARDILSAASTIRGPRPFGLQPLDHARTAAAQLLAFRGDRYAIRNFRGHRFVFSFHRPVRRYGALGQPANPGDWTAHRHGRDGRWYFATAVYRGHPARRSRPRDRRLGRVRRDANTEGGFSASRPGRPHNVRDHVHRLGVRGSAGLLDPGTAGDAGRPDGGVATRIGKGSNVLLHSHRTRAYALWLPYRSLAEWTPTNPMSGKARWHS